MKIVEITDSLRPGGGVNSFVFDLSLALRNAGCDVLLIGITQTADHQELISLREAGVIVETLGAENKFDAVLHHIPRLRKRILDFSDGQKVVCNLHLKLSVLMGCLATIGLSNVKNVETYHNTYHHYHFQCFVLRPRIKKYICVSEEARREMRRRFHTRDKDTIAIPNGVSRQQIRCSVPDGEVEKEKRDEVRAISIGRLSYEKNFLTSVRALAEVCNDHLSYTVVGGGPQLSEMQEIADKNEYITLAGSQPREKCMELLSQSDIVIMPSLWEGRSILQLEAAAFDKPMILSDVPGLREPFHEKSLSDEELFRVCSFGYLVRTNDVKSYQAAVKHFIENRDKLGVGMREAVKRVSIENDISIVAEKYLGCFSECFI